jgi:prophage regulatory protein|tara:strand:+ start:289 stop:522 length:234 start_codon:yes stop_codon:yes gene_type:complete
MEKFQSQIIRLKQVKAMTGLSRTTIYRFMSINEFPKQIKLGPKSSGWLIDEVDEWIKRQIQIRDNRQIKVKGNGKIK